MTVIDLNADMGEGFGPWAMGDDAGMLESVTSASLACGGHAGDPETMFTALCLARDRGVTIGAHPGYADREGFGRRVIPMTAPEITRMIVAQTGALQALAALAGTRLRYVKAHGALANLAAADPVVAGAVADAVAALPGELALLAISGTALETVARQRKLRVFSEIFADRAYQADGQLVPRSKPGAVLHDADQIATRLIGYLASGEMPVAGGGTVRLAGHSVCIHGDTPGAAALARALHARLSAASITLAPFLAA